MGKDLIEAEVVFVGIEKIFAAHKSLHAHAGGDHKPVVETEKYIGFPIEVAEVEQVVFLIVGVGEAGVELDQVSKMPSHAAAGGGEGVVVDIEVWVFRKFEVDVKFGAGKSRLRRVRLSSSPALNRES